MSDKEDDEVTKVLNLNDLKQDPDEDTNKNFAIDLYLLNYKTDFFIKNESLFANYFTITIVESLEELNKLVLKHPRIHIAIYYNSEPKIANALLKQLNEHHPEIQSIIIAENLSPDKVKLHQAQPFAAKHYHDIKKDLKDLAQKLE